MKTENFVEKEESSSLNENFAETNESTDKASKDNKKNPSTDISEETLVENLEKDLESYKSKYLMICADMENMRKRFSKEKTELILSGSKDLIETLLPVIDDLERAHKSTNGTDKKSELYKGVSLIKNKILDLLKKFGLKKIDTKKFDKFNPDIHEAITSIPLENDESKANTIADITEEGYELNEKIIRYSKVVIFSNPEK